MKKTLHIAVALAVTLTLSNCYGPFNLTRKLHRWNGQVGENWVNEFVFLGLVILPAYALASLADAIIFNSIEFWTGKNPIMVKKIKTLREGDAEAVLSYDPALCRLRVDSFEKSSLISTVVFEPGLEEGVVARNGRGELLMSARTHANGSVILTDASGREVGHYLASQIEYLLEKTH